MKQHPFDTIEEAYNDYIAYCNRLVLKNKGKALEWRKSDPNLADLYDVQAEAFGKARKTFEYYFDKFLKGEDNAD